MRSKAWFGFVCVALLLAAPTSVSATNFSVFASYYDTDDYNEALGFGVRVAFFERVQLEFGASYYEEFGRTINIDLGGGTVIGFDESLLDLVIVPIEIGVRFNFSALYAGVGGAYYSLDTDLGVDDEYGLYARLGAQFGRFFAELVHGCKSPSILPQCASTVWWVTRIAISRTLHSAPITPTPAKSVQTTRLQRSTNLISIHRHDAVPISRLSPWSTDRATARS